MRRSSRWEVLAPAALALVVAELGARALSPREPEIEPQPVDLHEYFSDEEIVRGARFARPQRAIALSQMALELGGLIAAVKLRPRLLRSEVGQPVADGALTAAKLTLGLAAAPLPLSALARRRAIKVGLATQSWRGWGSDLAKSTAIGTGLAAAAGAVVTELTRRSPRRWWLPAGAGSVVVGAGFTTLGPVLLDPLFNDFTPLPEGQTRSDVLELARAAGVEVGEVYSVDASRRTRAANAYVGGLGPTKRVVLFDTLLERYSRDELRVVVAHELSHVRNRDVPRAVLYAAIVAPFTALAVQRTSWALSSDRGTAAALPALALAAALISAPTGLIGNRLSRAVERRADAYSLELSGAPNEFISFERTIALQNVADLDPPRWVTKLLATHPPTLERIGAAVAYALGNREDGDANAAPASAGTTPAQSAGATPRAAPHRRIPEGS